MKKIYLIRHAQSQSNAGLFIDENHKIALTELGHSQAKELGVWLSDYINEPVSDVLISTYLRTQQTAEPYLLKHGAEPVVIEGLREFNYLDFEHIKELPFEQVANMAEAFWQTGNIHYQDSERTDNFAHFVGRVQKVRAYFDELPDGVYVVFTHGMWIGMLLWQILHANSERIFDMKRFREFELAIRPNNCEVYQLLLPNNSITKVYVQSP